MRPMNPSREASLAFGLVPRILVYDQSPEHRALICKIVSQVGARPVKVITGQQLRCSAECCIAVVGMGTEIGGAELKVVRELKATGFRVIACGEGAESWSLNVRCLPLLAGAGVAR